MIDMEAQLAEAREVVVPEGPHRGRTLGDLKPNELQDITSLHRYRKWSGLVRCAKLLWTERSHSAKKTVQT